MDRSNRFLWIGLGILAALALVASSWGGGMMMASPFGPRPFIGGPWFLGIWGIGLLVRLLFVGGLIFLVVRLFSGARRPYVDDFHRPEDLPAGEILRRRYAAGDITREQYEEMRQTLEPAG